MASMDEIRAQATPERVPVEICVDRELLGRYKTAVDQLSDRRQTTVGMMHDPEDVRALADEVIALDAEVKAKTHTWWITKIPRSEWNDLMSEHPASDEVKARQEAELEAARQVDARAAMDVTVDWETFSLAAVSASCVEPVVTVNDARWLRETLPAADWDQLFNTCAELQANGTTIPKYVSGIVAKLSSELSSTMPQGEASPSASSGAASSKTTNHSGPKKTGKRPSSGSRSSTAAAQAATTR